MIITEKNQCSQSPPLTRCETSKKASSGQDRYQAVSRRSNQMCRSYPETALPQLVQTRGKTAQKRQQLFSSESKLKGK
jgi:hypothetical protein